MRENNLRDKFRDAIIKDIRGHVTNHEEKFVKGVFDASYVFRYDGEVFTGWVEMKHLPGYPKRKDTPIRIGIRAEQKIWAHERLPHGQKMFILARIEDDIFMWSAEHIQLFYDGISVDHMERLWLGKWHRSIVASELRDILCGR